MTAPTTGSAMYQTMQRQPSDLRRLLETGWGPASEAAERLAGARRVFTVGIGTSYHAALVGAWLLRAAGCDARAISSFDFAFYPEAAEPRPDDAVVVMAHTGVRQSSAEALRKAGAAGATVISIGSETAEHPGSQLILRTVERERSAAYTASHLAAMTILAQIATALGETRGTAATAGFRAALGRLPEQVAEVLSREDDVAPIARQAVGRRIYAVGAGPNEATATEAVIKVREAAQGWIDGLALEQFLHGPIAAVNEGDLAIVIDVSGRAAERLSQIERVLAAIGTQLWLIGRASEDLANATVFPLPEMPELISPLLAVVPVQLFAYHLAVAKDLNPDRFRRDDARYEAAFGLVKL